MKILILFFSFCLIGCKKDLFLSKDGLLYLGDSPYSGSYTKKSGKYKKNISYENGLKHGVEIHYYPTGEVFKKINYKVGKLEGKSLTFYKSSKMMKEAFFRNGLSHGDYTEWYESGQVYIYSKYKEGRQLGYKKWRPNGKIYANYIIHKGKNIGLSGGKLCFKAQN